MGGVGRRAKTIKSRIVAWLCGPCRDKDSDFNIEKHDAPGMRSEALERVRAAKEMENASVGTARDRTQEGTVQTLGQGPDGSNHAGDIPVAVHADRTSGG